MSKHSVWVIHSKDGDRPYCCAKPPVEYQVKVGDRILRLDYDLPDGISISNESWVEPVQEGVEETSWVVWFPDEGKYEKDTSIEYLGDLSDLSEARRHCSESEARRFAQTELVGPWEVVGFNEATRRSRNK